ncbi:MAG TPA: hypothetical protein PKY77_05080 [Phycisphaerae bacterium]|nr:hypothetical protein [Phycisphaerae bacterium]HRY68887.1 hypothetical protein [Phycisphaerae bacterium]HSA25714.1 hypothetical protein [Phycisphaerae bacterium]
MAKSLAYRRTITGSVLVILVLTSPTLATHITWDFQKVVSGVSSPPLVSLGMRTGETWPTVFYDRAGVFKAASLTPAGWSETALSPVSGNATMARAHAGPDGRVGVTWINNPYEVRFAQSSRNGWSSSGAGTAMSNFYYSGGPDFAYLSNNRPVVVYMGNVGPTKGLALSVYDGLGWNTDLVDKVMVGTQVRPTGERPTIAVDSQDRIGLAFRSGSEVIVAIREPGQGTWYGASLGTNFPSSSNTTLSLGYSSNDNVALAVKSDSALLVSQFDIQSGAWVTEQLSSTVASQRVNLVFDSQGHPAVAYVGTDGSIHYRINNGDGWSDIVLPRGTDPLTGLVLDPYLTSDAALAFDRFDNPVIAYGGAANIILAYDPVVPEPASVLMLVVGLAMLRPRRR